MSIGENIRFIRGELGLTQAQLAENLGVSPGYIPMLEKGSSKPSDLFITALCSRFFVSEQWLRSGEGMPFCDADEVLNLLGNRYSLLQLNEALGRKTSAEPVPIRNGGQRESEGDLKRILDYLSALWAEGDRNMHGWIIVQFRNAFPAFAGDAQKKSAPSGAGTTNGAQIG